MSFNYHNNKTHFDEVYWPREKVYQLLAASFSDCQEIRSFVLNAFEDEIPQLNGELPSVEGAKSKNTYSEAVYSFFETKRLIGDLLGKLKEINTKQYNASKEQLKENDAKEISYIVVAMTKSEAEKVLSDGDVDVSQHGAFQKFKSLFPENQHQVWLANYGDSPEEWRPYGYIQHLSENSHLPLNFFNPESKEFVDIAALTVEDILMSLLGEANERRKERKDSPIDLQSATTGFYEKNQVKLEKFEDHLLSEDKKKRCLLIVDGLSLFNKEIATRFSKSRLINKTNAVLIITPINDPILQMELVIEEVFRNTFERPFTRYDTLEQFYEIGSKSLWAVQRWLLMTLFSGVEHGAYLSVENRSLLVDYWVKQELTVKRKMHRVISKESIGNEQ